MHQLRCVSVKLRIQYPESLYLLINRGDRPEAIFEDDSDRERFLDTLVEVCLRTGWQVHAYWLMGITCLCRARQIGFHLVMEIPQATLVPGMQWFSPVKKSDVGGGEGTRDHCRRVGIDGLSEADLGRWRKGDVWKVRVARRLRRETKVVKRWVDHQLAMGSVSNVAFCLAASGIQ